MDRDWLAQRFENDRERLQAVAFRLLGSQSEADDAVQETWLRLSRSDADEIANLSGWLTTVVGRVCLDMLRSRRTRREDTLEAKDQLNDEAVDPEQEAILAESVGLAMQVVLQRLSPSERVAFVLHDVFGVPFDDIAGIVGRSPDATRQLASRGRRRVQGTSADSLAADEAQHRTVVEAFFRASRDGDVQALLSVLDPDVVLHADETAATLGQKSGWLQSELRGAELVAGQFAGRAAAAQLATIDGEFGAVWAPGGRPRVVFLLNVEHDMIAAINLIADPAMIEGLQIEIFTTDGVE